MNISFTQRFFQLLDNTDSNALQDLIVECTNQNHSNQMEEIEQRKNYQDILSDPIFADFHKGWFQIIEEQSFRQLKQCYDKAYAHEDTLPTQENVFNVFKMDPLKIKCIIIGQDPYPGRGNDGVAHACGYSFATNSKYIPLSLKNIRTLIAENHKLRAQEMDLKHFDKDFDDKVECQPNLKSWIDQGVFLLNFVLTVSEGQPFSHENIGWQIPLAQILQSLNRKLVGYIVLLFGQKAQEMQKYFGKGKIFTCPHPAMRDLNVFLQSKIFLNVWKQQLEQKQQPIQF